ncbi:MAG: hypothetical protein U5K69_06205 [Balneolaceae bacterium]|nr:hypothetical protein [Balneolaceae bacterium]
MDKICRSVESQVSHIYNSLEYVKPEWKEKQIIESLAYSCISMSDNVEAKVIAAITQSGNTRQANCEVSS